MAKDLRKLRQALTRGLLLTGRHWRRLADRVVKVHGLSEATALPLVLIGREPGQTQVELADALGMEGPSLVRLLDQLSALGLIIRREDQSDRRAKILDLTEAGKRTLREVEAELTALREQVFGHISASDLEAALRVLQAIENFPTAHLDFATVREEPRKRMRA